LLGRVLAAHGPVLLAAFRGAMIACAVACVLAALSTFVLLAPTKSQGNARRRNAR
jgi:hypothetical protein